MMRATLKSAVSFSAVKRTRSPEFIMCRSYIQRLYMDFIQKDIFTSNRRDKTDSISTNVYFFRVLYATNEEKILFDMSSVPPGWVKVMSSVPPGWVNIQSSLGRTGEVMKKKGRHGIDMKWTCDKHGSFRPAFPIGCILKACSRDSLVFRSSFH